MQTYQMKMLHALYYNSKFPMFLFIGTEQKQYILRKKQMTWEMIDDIHLGMSFL